MRKPEAIFDRTDEWTTLTAFGSATNSPALGVVSGRRRHGKSFVLRHLVESTGGFYHQAIQVDARLALTRLGEDLARHLDVPASLDLRSWDAAIRALLALKGRVVVLDEYPYLAASSPELASVSPPPSCRPVRRE